MCYDSSMLLLQWFLSALSLLVVSQIVPGFTIDGLYSALIAALILGIANILVKPILVLLTLPITIITLGGFLLIINALVLWLVSTIVKGFDFTGFGAAFIASILLWLLNLAISWLFNQRKQQL